MITAMKKLLLLAAAAILSAGMVQAKTADELRIYLNPGHGSFGANDRPLPTVGHPFTGQLNSAGTTWIDTDTLGFYEGRGTLPRAFGIGDYLKKLGVKAENIVYSRLTNGPWPYTMPNSEYDPGAIYNRNLSEICEEVEAGNFDMFISDHSNAATDGTTTNYPLYLYRGTDTENAVEGSRAMAETNWGYHYMDELDPQNYYSRTNMNIRGDVSFYGSGSNATRSNGKTYYGYLGVLKHGAPGYLLEGFFHTYQPARHRALNFDYDRQEGRREARGIAKYFNLGEVPTGDIMGTVKDLHQKIAEKYFGYAPGTNDQWLPLNGAKVNLLKDGNVVATYNVDNEYNGIFVFEDLQPGKYTLQATMDGYKAQGEYTKKSINSEYEGLVALSMGEYEVVANNTIYAKLYLEAEDFVPEEQTYENYPDPAQPGYLAMPDEFTMMEEFKDKAVEVLADKTVRRTLLRDGHLFVLALDANKTPYIYQIDPNTQTVEATISTTGITAPENNQGSNVLAISDIAFTADGTLLACNALQNQYSATQVAEGFTRGTFRVYRWEKDIDNELPTGDPAEMFTSQLSGNWFNADLGNSMAYSGSIKEGKLITSAVTIGSSRGIRTMIYNIDNGNLISSARNNHINDDYTAVKYGEDFQFAISPNDENSIIINGSGAVPGEYKLANGDGSIIIANGKMNAANATATGVSVIRYAKHSILLTNDNGQPRMYDITNGLDNAKEINIELEAVAAPKRAPSDAGAPYLFAHGLVNDVDLNVYYNTADGTISKLTTENVNQEIVKGILAYGLESVKDGDAYTFNFKANDNAQSGRIIFTDSETGEVVGEYPLTDVVEGDNTVTLNYDQIPGTDEQKLNWAVELTGKPISTIARLNDITDNQYVYTGNLFNTIDKSPESKFFGRIYTVNRVASNNANNGLYAYEPDWTRINETRYNGGQSFGSPYRLTVDSEGTIYIPDWSDPHSGIFVADPANLEGEYTQFFEGTRANSGLFTNNGVNVGGSTPGVNIFGEGANTVLYVFNEDVPGPSGNGNGVGVYNIGQPDGTIAHTWGEAPSNYFDIGAWMANTNGNIVADGRGGVWVAQTRSPGNNTGGVPSLVHVNPQGTIDLNSGREPYADMLTGSWGSGFAINNEGNILVINDGNATLQFFELTWNENDVPELSPLYSYKVDCRNGDNVYQINFDYAGNLVCSGNKLGIYSMPTDDNTTLTPARKELLIEKTLTGVENINSGKTISSVSYVNMAGMVSDKPFEGVNVVITRYTDGTNSTTKVVK